jgi:hypothetical protein
MPSVARINLKAEYERIGSERDAAGRVFDRERRLFMVMTVVYCWLWTIAGLAVMGVAFHIPATIGWIELPRQMMKAKAYFWGGVMIGTGGGFGTLVYRWRQAMERGMLD